MAWSWSIQAFHMQAMGSKWTKHNSSVVFWFYTVGKKLVIVFVGKKVVVSEMYICILFDIEIKFDMIFDMKNVNSSQVI